MTTATCTHHWICQDSRDGKVPAKCSRCGAETVFKPEYNGLPQMAVKRPRAWDLPLIGTNAMYW